MAQTGRLCHRIIHFLLSFLSDCCMWVHTLESDTLNATNNKYTALKKFRAMAKYGTPLTSMTTVVVIAMMMDVVCS